MKLRVKMYPACPTTYRVEVAPNASVSDLHAAIRLAITSLPSSSILQLSLNKKDILPSCGESPVSSLGFCTGDIVWLMLSEASWMQASSVTSSTHTQRDKPGSVSAKSTSPQTSFPENTNAQTGLTITSDAAAEPGPESEALDHSHAPEGQPSPGFLQRVLAASLSSSQIPTPHHLLVLAVHATMLEAGYTPLPHGGKVSEGSVDHAPTWAGSSWSCAYQWCPTAEPQDGLPTATVRALQLGPHLVLHLLVASSHRVSTLHLPVAQHIQPHVPGPSASASASASSTSAPSQAAPALARYAALPLLWRQLKDEAALPLLAAIHFAANRQPPLGLLTLPMELKQCILSLLPADDLNALSGTCHELRHLAAADTFWRRLFLRAFPDTSAADRQEAERRGWRWAYARHYSVRQARRLRCNAMTPQPHHPFFGPAPFAPAHRGGFPLAIGGDYDRLPMLAPGIGPGLFSGARGSGWQQGPTAPFGRLGSQRGGLFRTY